MRVTPILRQLSSGNFRFGELSSLVHDAFLFVVYRSPGRLIYWHEFTYITMALEEHERDLYVNVSKFCEANVYRENSEKSNI